MSRLKRYFKIELYPFTKKKLKNFCTVCDSPVSVDMDVQKCGQKRTYFFMEKIKRTKADEKRILCKSTFDNNFALFS